MKGGRTERCAVTLVALLLASVACVQLSVARAEAPPLAARTLSPQKLAGVGDYFKNEVATGKIPGAVALVQQHGRPVYFETFGKRDVANPMTKDTIFRLYSMSKPITSVAAMML